MAHVVPNVVWFSVKPRVELGPISNLFLNEPAEIWPASAKFVRSLSKVGRARPNLVGIDPILVEFGRNVLEVAEPSRCRPKVGQTRSKFRPRSPEPQPAHNVPPHVFHRPSGTTYSCWLAPAYHRQAEIGTPETPTSGPHKAKTSHAHSPEQRVRSPNRHSRGDTPKKEREGRETERERGRAEED